MTEILDKINTSLHSIESQYHRLIILVNCEEAGKQDVLDKLASGRDIKQINLNLELSSRLLEYSIKQRPLKVTELLEEIVQDTPSPVMLDRIDVLFEPSLQTDPLAILKALSRSKTIVAFWNGALKDNKLYYAEPAYPEYKSYPVQDFVAIDAQPHESF